MLISKSSLFGINSSNVMGLPVVTLWFTNVDTVDITIDSRMRRP